MLLYPKKAPGGKRSRGSPASRAAYRAAVKATPAVGASPRREGSWTAARIPPAAQGQRRGAAAPGGGFYRHSSFPFSRKVSPVRV
jgi:hypothetical protein